jgi:release factor glutamine methyltransferase
MGCNLNHCKFASMTIEDANRLLIASLTGLYDEREAASVSSLVMERLTGMPKGLRVLNKRESFTNRQQELFQDWLTQLLRFRPVQYILGEAWFGPFPFYVDENVLIPRPETEELADWLLKDNADRPMGSAILDIGTGSGCIAVYLKKKRKDFSILGIDISEAALEIAKKNSLANEAETEFLLCDIRDPAQRDKLSPVDLIISNPPYIPERQKTSLDKHVKDFEPAVALFVPDEDPILYYKIIGDFAIEKLLPGGAVFLEIHHDFANDITEWYRLRGFLLELKKDFSGNNRMIKAFLS